MKSKDQAKIRLRLKDPDAGYATGGRNSELPTLAGRIVADIEGFFGKRWHLIELEAPLPIGFDPLSSLPATYKSTPIQHLLVSPAPSGPEESIAQDYIHRALAKSPLPNSSAGRALCEMCSRRTRR